MLYLIKQSMCCSAVGIATHYELDGPGIESGWKRKIPHLSGASLVTTQRPVKWVPALSRGQTAEVWR